MDTKLHTEALREAQIEIERLERRLDQVRNVAAYHAEKCQHVDSPVFHGTNGNNGSRIQAKIKDIPEFNLQFLEADRFASMGQREAAVEVLKEAGKPMRTPDIAREMVAGGYSFEGPTSKLANALFTSFKRGPAKFRKVGPGQWELADPE